MDVSEATKETYFLELCFHCSVSGRKPIEFYVDVKFSFKIYFLILLLSIEHAILGFYLSLWHNGSDGSFVKCPTTGSGDVGSNPPPGT